ncbi:hypothetical protein [Nonomuraea sp. NPDC049750]
MDLLTAYSNTPPQVMELHHAVTPFKGSGSMREEALFRETVK